jgi:hypothetical protein
MKAGSLTVTKDFTKDFTQLMKQFRNDAVLVGIPEEENPRESGAIGNAALLAINHFGSPANNIPARPVMTIGIKNAQDDIANEFKKAAQSVLSKGSIAIDTYYERAGIIASNAVKKAINDQAGFPGPSASTLRARASKGFKGTKSLIVTAQLRNAITYVVRKGG